MQIEKVEEKIKEKSESINKFEPEENLEILSIKDIVFSNVIIKYYKYRTKIDSKHKNISIIYKENKLEIKEG